jgi:hypothetical protein
MEISHNFTFFQLQILLLVFSKRDVIDPTCFPVMHLALTYERRVFMHKLVDLAANFRSERGLKVRLSTLLESGLQACSPLVDDHLSSIFVV